MPKIDHDAAVNNVRATAYAYDATGEPVEALIAADFRYVADMADAAQRLAEALSLPLRFHSGAPWTPDDADAWERITGTKEATSKVMCDAIRTALTSLPQKEEG